MFSWHDSTDYEPNGEPPNPENGDTAIELSSSPSKRYKQSSFIYFFVSYKKWYGFTLFYKNCIIITCNITGVFYNY